MPDELAPGLISGGGASHDSWAREKTSRLFGSGSRSVPIASYESITRPDNAVLQSLENLYAEYERQGLILNENHVPDHMKERVSEHNKRVRAATKNTASDANTTPLKHDVHGGGPPPPPVAPHPVADDNGGMETRIEKLEDFASETRERLARVETKIDHIDKEVSNFKWWVIAQIAAGFVAVLGTGIAVQQMTVASFQGAAQVAKDAAPVTPAPQQPPIIINVPPAAAAPAGK